MKRILITVVVCLVVLSACKKNNLNDTNVWRFNADTSAFVKFVNSYTALTPSIATPANGPGIDFYINNVKMNATILTYGTFFPNTSGGASFAAVPSGPVEIKAVLSRPLGGGLPSDTIAKGNFILGPGVSHSVILVDPLPNPTPANPILMVHQEAVKMPAYGTFKFRLMNMVATTEVYELFNSTTSTILTAPIPFKNFSNWIELPVPTTGTQGYQIRLAGTTTVMASITAFSASNQRSYTFWARGNPLVTGRTRTLSSILTQ